MYNYKVEKGKSLNSQYRWINIARKFSLTVCTSKRVYDLPRSTAILLQNEDIAVGEYKISDVDYNS